MALLAHQETASARDIFGRSVEMPLAKGGYKNRPNYIDALEAADSGDLQPLVRLFSEIQRLAFEGAIKAARG